MKQNPLEELTWEERFKVAWDALLRAEHRAEDAEALLGAVGCGDEIGALRKWSKREKLG